jgi:hypothetical protein
MALSVKLYRVGRQGQGSALHCDRLGTAGATARRKRSGVRSTCGAECICVRWNGFQSSGRSPAAPAGYVDDSTTDQSIPDAPHCVHGRCARLTRSSCSTLWTSVVSPKRLELFSSFFVNAAGCIPAGCFRGFAGTVAVSPRSNPR